MPSLSSILLSSIVARAVVASSLAVLLTCLLELVSIAQVRELLRKKGGTHLYRSALLGNLFNNLFLGPLTYYIAAQYVCWKGPACFLHQVLSVIGIVLIEGVLYYYLHRCFHEVPGLYWIHRYHHKFNTVVLPSSANAVSVAEYVCAYMIPIVIGVVVTSADEISAILAASIIAVTNLVIHTPYFASSKFHWIFVSTQDHLDHHNKNKGNYGAPVLHTDRILSWFSKHPR